MVFDTTINLTTLICAIGFPTVIVYLGRHRRAGKIRDINLSALIETVFYSANGQGKDLRKYFNDRVKEGMEKNKFIEGK